MIKKLCLVIAAMLCLQSYSNAQHVACGSAAANDYLAAHDKAYAASLSKQLQSWVKYNKAQQAGQAAPLGPSQPTGPQGLITNTAAGPLYTIPVVFHIIHTGQAVGTAQNPSDATIQSLVAYMNQVYTATWSANPDTNSGGVRVPIQFALAQRSPTCQATTGINRVNGSSVSGYSQYGIAQAGASLGADEATVKALSIWPNDRYVNIWIVTNIQGAAANGGAVAGYAYFPGTSSDIDGMTLRYDQTNWAIAHEMGHILGLLHTFQGSSDETTCPTNTDCTSQGDLVCDTDPLPLVTDCLTGTNPCTNAAYGAIIYNIMGYTSCPNRFTAGQKTRMLFELQNYRGGLLTSLGALAPGAANPNNLAAPATACVPTAIGSGGYDVGPANVTLSDLNYGSGGLLTDENQYYIDHTVNTCLQGQQIAHLSANSTYTMTVTPATSYNNESAVVWIDWNNNGTFENSEMVMSSYDYSADVPATATFTVPATGVVTCVPLRMRVSSDFYGVSMPTACSNPEYGQVEDFTVLVQTPAPTIVITTQDTSICAGSTATFTAAATGGGASPTYQWKKNGVNAGTNSATFTASNLVNGDTISCSYASGSTCYPTAITSNKIRVTVRATATPTNVVAASPGNSVCAGTTVTFTSTTNITGATRQWKKNGVNVGTNAATYSYVPANGDTIKCVLTVPVSGCFTASTVTSNATVMTVTPNVAPTNVITVSPNDTVNAGTAVTFTSASNITGGTRQWKKNGANVGTGAATFSYTPANGDTVTCVLTVPGTGCFTASTVTSNAIRMTVINTVTNAGTLTGLNYVCVGSTITLTDSAGTAGGTWSSLYTSKATVTQAGVVTGVSLGVDTIKYTVNGVVAKKAITVYALPVVAAGADVTMCQSTATTLTATGGTSYVWTPTTGLSCTTCASPIATPTTTTTYVVTGTKTGCSSKDTVKVNINPLPVAGTLTGPAVVGPGATITLTDSAGTTGGTWSSTNTTTATVNQSGLVTGGAFGTDTIKYAVTNNCGTVIARKVINVVSAGTITGINYLCVGSTIALADSGGTTGGTWSSIYTTKATVSQTGVVTGISQGVDTIKYTVNGVVAKKAITIYALPTVVAGGDVTVCQGTATTLTATGGTSYIWSPATGLSCTTCASPVATPITTTSYIVTGTKTGCSSKDTVKVSIYPLPNAGVITGPATVSPGGTIALTDSTATAVGVWSSVFSSVATVTNTSGVVTGVTAGVDTIKYTVSNSCGTATARKVITVAVPANPGSITGLNYLCVGASITLTDSAGTPGGVWSSVYTAKATVNQNGVVTGISQGVDTIKYTVGGVVAKKAITVYALPAVSAGADVNIAPGGSVTLTATGATSYVWSPATGLSCTSCASPVASPTTTTSYIVTGTKTGCSAKDTVKVTVTASKEPMYIGGIDNNQVTEVKIYPNPVRGEVAIEFVVSSQDLQVTLMDVAGKQVAEIADVKQATGNQRFVYNAAALTRGLYYVRIRAGGQVATKKIVVE